MTMRSTVRFELRLAGEQDIARALGRNNEKLDEMGRKGKRAGKDASDGFKRMAVAIGQLDFKGILHSYADISHAISDVTSAAQVAWNAIKRGEQAALVGKVFAQNFGDASAALERFKSATLGTIDELTLERRANRARQMGLAIEDIEAALTVAQFSAMTTGESFESTFDQIVEGAKDLTDSFAEATGVFIDSDRALALYAERHGKLVSQLTETEKRMARTEAAFAGLRIRAEEVGNQLREEDVTTARFSAQVSDLGVAVDKAAGAMIAWSLDALTPVSEDLEGLASTSERLNVSLAQFGRILIQNRQIALQVGSAQAQMDEAALEKQKERVAAAAELAKLNKDTLRLVTAAQKPGRKGKAPSVEVAQDVAGQLQLILQDHHQAMNAAEIEHNEEQARLVAWAIEFKKNAEEEGAEEAIERQRKLAEKLQEIREEEQEKIREAEEKKQREIEESIDAMFRLSSAAENSSSDMVRAFNGASKIAGVLGKNWKALAAASPAAIAALGEVSASAIDDTRVQAGVQGAFAQGLALLELTKGNIPGYITGQLAAAALFAVAGGAGGGGGSAPKASATGGGSGPVGGASFAGASEPSGGGGDVTYVVQGWIGSGNDLPDAVSGDLERVRRNGLGRGRL